MAQTKKATAPVVNIETAPNAENGNNGSTQSAPAPAPQPTSDKLTELKNQRKAKWQEANTLEYDSKEQMEAFSEVVKIDGLIKAEIAAIKKAEQDAELAEKRNARVKLFDDAIMAYDNARIANDGDGSIDDKNAAYDAYKAARELVINELLSRFAASTPSKSVATGDAKPAGERGATSQKIRERYIALIGEGKTPTEANKQIVSEGFSRGTTGAVILAYQREIGEKA